VTDFPLVDWWKVGANLLTVASAYLLALPVAWEREHHARTAGLRTFPLVAVASSGYMLLAESMFSGNAEAVARVVQGLMTGIGFIGGGAILKHGANVRGTAPPPMKPIPVIRPCTTRAMASASPGNSLSASSM